MGCTCAKQPDSPFPVPRVRRSLSLGDVGPPGKLEESERDVAKIEGALDRNNEDDRSLLMRLSKEQVLDMVASGGETMSRTFSIGSSTDEAMEKVASFSSKTVKLDGTKFEPAKDFIGYSCKKGLKPEYPNQDSFFILKVEQDFSIYGVFDGHGRLGHDISNFVKDHLPKVLLMDPELATEPLEALGRAFEQTQRLIVQATELEKIDASRSGTTCSVIFNDHKTNTLHVAHVGDSRCVLGRTVGAHDNKKQQWRAVDLTKDHKPSLPEEKARIEAAGGVVLYDGGWNHRVYAKNQRGPGLNMSRAMGDLVGFFHAGISASPDVRSHVIVPGDRKEQMQGMDSGSSKPSLASYQLTPEDKFVLLCSDGVWEFLDSGEVVNLVGHYGPGDEMKAAERLAAVAWESWMKEMNGEVVDDITAVLVNLSPGINAAK